MKKNLVSTLIFVLLVQLTFGQNSHQIKGTFVSAKDKEIRIMGFAGTQDTLISQTKTDSLGNFNMSYSKNYRGAATIQVKDLTNLIVLLNKETMKITWADFKDFDGVKFSNTLENTWFQEAFQINMEAQKRLAGLNYLLPLYKNEINKKEWTAQLNTEIALENGRFGAYQKQLSEEFYVKSYLKYRGVFQQMLKENKTKEEEIAAENAFLGLDFSSMDLYHSGIVKDFFDAYFKQVFKLENKELIVKKINIFSELVKSSIQSKPIILNNYVEYLVKQYEKYGLLEAAEHLALSLLDDNKCRMDAKTLPLLEQYKKMAIGNVAPQVVFSNQLKYKSSSDIKAKYKVIVFGASWCEECKVELPQFKEYAEIFKTKYDAEIVFVSIDTKEEEFKNFTKDFPFASTCDLKGWEGSNVKNYYVFATPSIYVLDIENKIVAKPSNAINTSRWFFDNIK